MKDKDPNKVREHRVEENSLYVEEDDVFFVYAEEDFPKDDKKRIGLDLQRFIHKNKKHKSGKMENKFREIKSGTKANDTTIQSKVKSKVHKEKARTEKEGGNDARSENPETTWKAIQTADGTSTQQVRTILVPLHKVM